MAKPTQKWGTLWLRWWISWPNMAQCQWKRKTLVADSILSFCWLNVLNPQTFGDASRAMLYRSLMFVCGIPYTEVIGTIGRIWMTILRLILVPSGWCFPPRRRLSRILPIDLLKDIKRLHTDWSIHRTIPKNMGLTMGKFPDGCLQNLNRKGSLPVIHGLLGNLTSDFKESYQIAGTRYFFQEVKI